MDQTEELPVRFFDQLDTVKTQLLNKEILIFLDYDGTLTPIVATPDLAVITEEMREVVKSLAKKYKVSIVSGRATDDVRSKVQIDGIFYAGSHGFEIVSPDGEVEINQQAQEIRPVIDEVHKKLSECLKDVEGALVEHVKYTISAHYRLVSDEDVPKVEKAVEDLLNEYPSLRKTDGKKVFEIRPKIDWDKGKAVNWILKVWGFEPDKGSPVYIGDDTTDEDAFREIKSSGFGILVAQEPRASEAKYFIRDTDEVEEVLETFIQMAG